jgi:DNA polymerase-3 subunit delta'
MAGEFEQREPDAIEGVPAPEFATTVVGHEAALADIRNRLAHGRLPGGVLMHGPRGIGKATLAFRLAREVFAATGDEDPAHVEEQVAAGSYPNLFLLRKAPRDTGKGFYTVIRVDEVRTTIERLHRTRGRAGHRIVVVDPIDDANDNSANALLKVLEEPPPETTFLLISHRPGSLLPTIRSRCHAVALRPIGDEGVRAVLAVAGATGDLDMAVALAGGIPRRGFEALLLGDAAALAGLRGWLANPARGGAAGYLGLADALSSRDSAEARFGRDMLLSWIAEEARTAGAARNRSRLASANELWEKAVALFEDTDEYNLDIRQTLVAIFDAIRRHVQSHLAVAEPS